MTQQTMPPPGPQSSIARVDATAPLSPTKSIWKRLLNRGSHYPSSDAPTKVVSAQPALPSPPTQVTKPVTDVVSSIDSNDLTKTADGDDRNAKFNGTASRRARRDVVPGLPRTQTMARQQSELRENLMPIVPTPAERRAVSMDRRLASLLSNSEISQLNANPRISAPTLSHNSNVSASDLISPYTRLTRTSLPDSPVSVLPPGGYLLIDDKKAKNTENARDFPASVQPEHCNLGDAISPNMTVASVAETLVPINDDNFSDDGERHSTAIDKLSSMEQSDYPETASLASSQFERKIRYELENIWILNLSMHFRDRSRREKFFVTYRQQPDLARRVTVSLDYRNAPEDSLEKDLSETKLQRDKNEMIYEAIRESLVDIQFYDTVTNLKLQTTDGRLHVHVVEDVTEVIHYPSSLVVQHLSCRKIRERDVKFDAHLSGFVYKVCVDGQRLIKKEIPSPDTIDEFLYEVNALNFLRHSRNVIELYGVIVSDDDRVKGLLISYAEQGALIDIIYDYNFGIPWATREKWARQIVLGLSEIHEAGFVQGDFTLSNIVIDDDGNAKIIDINRRGCPVGWEPPEATPLIQSGQQINMYIGVKSDLYQLGMVLWALATQYDNPEAHGRPLILDDEDDMPEWYRTIVETCLAEDPRVRVNACQLLRLFPIPCNAFGHSNNSDDDDEWLDRPRNTNSYSHSAHSGSLDYDSALLRYHADIEGDEVSHPNGSEILANELGNDSGSLKAGFSESLQSRITTVTPHNDWSYVEFGDENSHVDSTADLSNEPYFYPTRGRSSARPLHRSMCRTSMNTCPAQMAVDVAKSKAEEHKQDEVYDHGPASHDRENEFFESTDAINEEHSGLKQPTTEDPHVGYSSVDGNECHPLDNNPTAAIETSESDLLLIQDEVESNTENVSFPVINTVEANVVAEEAASCLREAAPCLRDNDKVAGDDKAKEFADGPPPIARTGAVLLRLEEVPSICLEGIGTNEKLSREDEGLATMQENACSDVLQTSNEKHEETRLGDEHKLPVQVVG